MKYFNICIMILLSIQSWSDVGNSGIFDQDCIESFYGNYELKDILFYRNTTETMEYFKKRVENFPEIKKVIIKKEIFDFFSEKIINPHYSIKKIIDDEVTLSSNEGKVYSVATLFRHKYGDRKKNFVLMVDGGVVVEILDLNFILIIIEGQEFIYKKIP